MTHPSLFSDPDPSTLLRRGQVFLTTFSQSVVTPSMDFETYSEAGFCLDESTGKVRGLAHNGKGGLPVVGTAVYAEHPSTRPHSLAYDLKDDQGIRLWLPGFPSPEDLLEHIRSGRTMEAWNVTFEWYIWNYVMTKRYGWPEFKLEQAKCVMAKAKRFSLPGSLENSSKALNLEGKDKNGKNLIQKLSRPHSKTKKRKTWNHTTVDAWDDHVSFWDYNRQDVFAEDIAALRIPDLSNYEHETWLTDQRINTRGVQVDTETLDAALYLLDAAEQKYNTELREITNNQVSSVAAVEQMRLWLSKQLGRNIPNTQKDTITELLGQVQDPLAKRVLQIRASLSSANVKKLRALKLQVSTDGRLRNQYQYCGADRTGRWSAGGVQLQNMTAKGPPAKECLGCGRIAGGHHLKCPFCGCTDQKELKDWTVKSVKQAKADIRERDLNRIEYFWGDPIKLLTGCLRGLFVSKQGYELLCCDFSAIEAVAAACLSRCQWRINVFAGHGKIYEQSAADLTGILLEEILAYKKEHGHHHPYRAKYGKICELASPYGGWIGAWKNFGAGDFFTDKEIKQKVLAWRAKSPEIVDMWGGQYRQYGPRYSDYRAERFGLEGCFINAVENPGKTFTYIDISYVYKDDIVFCRLPSGRLLYYHQPRLIATEDRLGRGVSLKITFMGYNSNPAKGAIGWIRQETYGGRLFENVDQATCADLQAEALVRCEQANYPIVMHTHDEGVAEKRVGEGSLAEMESIYSVKPSWASWWPIKAAGWIDDTYQKD